MTKKCVFKPVIFFLVFLGTVSGLFYYEKKTAVNLGENKYETVEKQKEILQPEKTASADIPIIKIGNDIVYYPEFEFYLLATKKDYEASLGNGVWNVVKNGRSIEELLKTDIIEEIARLKIIVNEAKKEGYSLTSAEEEEIKKTAKEQLQGIDPVLKARYYLDEKLVSGIYMENFLATRFFNEYSEKTGVEAESARRLFNEAYNRWESAYTADIYWENIDRIDVGELELKGE